MKSRPPPKLVRWFVLVPFAVLVSLPLLVMSILIGIGEGAVHWYEDLCDGFNIVLKDDLT